MRIRTVGRHRRTHSIARKDIKDRLIQTRVPESLESVLKREARRRRLSVSHLIRNLLEDTFELVDGVVGEVDTIVQDSVGLAGRVSRDALRIATGRRGASRSRDRARDHAASGARLGHGDDEPAAVANQERVGKDDAVEDASRERGEEYPAVDAKGDDEGTLAAEEHGEPATVPEPAALAATKRRASKRAVSLDHVLAWNLVVMNRAGECARCGVALRRGEQAHLGLSQTPGAAPTWLCSACIDSL